MESRGEKVVMIAENLTFSSLISQKLVPLLKRAEISKSSVVLQKEQVSTTILPNGINFIRLPYTFATLVPKATCTAAFKLVRLDGQLKVFTVTTALTELDAHPWNPLAIPKSPPIPVAMEDTFTKIR